MTTPATLIDTEALVIGGGPVGLCAALCLLERGLSVCVLDAGGERAVRGYACGLHPESLRIFDRLGLMPAILEGAHRVDRIVARGSDGRRVVAELGVLEGEYPYALALRQFDLEDILLAALQRRGVEVRRHHAVTQLYRRHGVVHVTGTVAQVPGLAPDAPPFFQHKACYVVAADGYFSTCRRALGLELTKVRPARAFAICEFNADLRGWQHDVGLALNGDAVAAFWPLGPELGRFSFEIFENLHETLNLDGLRALLAERAPWFEPRPEQLCWSASAPFEHMLAPRFGEDRIWLAGDAAHATSPIGFQSMNRGFSEARGLAAAIAEDLLDRKPGSRPFALFENEQQAEWARLLSLWGASDDTAWPERELSPCLPASGEDFEVLLEQLTSSQRSRSVAPGLASARA